MGGDKITLLCCERQRTKNVRQVHSAELCKLELVKGLTTCEGIFKQRTPLTPTDCVPVHILNRFTSSEKTPIAHQEPKEKPSSNKIEWGEIDFRILLKRCIRQTLPVKV